MNLDDSIFDVVIIGSGLAGLSAAHKLLGFKICIIEKDSRPGGRVITFHHPKAHVDLGASFGLRPFVFPKEEFHFL